MLLCHHRRANLAGDIEACGQCESCRLIEAGTHPDLHVVVKELARFSDDRSVRERKLLTIPFDVLREHLIEPVYHSAQLRHGKVFVIDEAELIDPRGQNILLKTLEEPPADTFIFLITSAEDRLLPTIRSRCQRIAFAPLPGEAIARWLDQRDPPMAGPQRDWLVRFAEGSLGRAQLAVQYDLFTWAQAVLPAIDGMAQGRLNAELGKLLKDLIDGFAQRWVDEHDNASKEAANKQAAGLMWAMIGQRARQHLARAAGTAGDDPAATEAALEPWLGAIESLGEAERNLAANVNMALVCDHLVLSLYRKLALA